MSQEILYTSAPRGLKRGSRGFCTVVSTDGMAGNLADRLESLSGYRHAFPLHDSRSKFNPVNYSHLIVTVAGQRYHVLSRVADAGEDYSGRSNKIAHHVALKPAELVESGPAAVLTSPGFCETDWDGEPRILPAGRRPAATPNEAGPCQTWQRLTGDAGWAGVLAESAVESCGRPMSVIFPAGTRTLPLVLEAMNLLPPEQRWTVSFSTYFTKLPAGVDCRWRFLLDDTPEAAAIRRNPHAPLIDLSDDLGTAPDSDYVEWARSGRKHSIPAVQAMLADEAQPPPHPGDGPPPPPPEAPDDGYRIRERPRPSRGTKRPPKPLPPSSTPGPHPRRRGVLLWVAVSVAFAMVLTAGLIGGYFWGHSAATRQIAEERGDDGVRRVDDDEGKTVGAKNGQTLVAHNRNESKTKGGSRPQRKTTFARSTPKKSTQSQSKSIATKQTPKLNRKKAKLPNSDGTAKANLNRKEKTEENPFSRLRELARSGDGLPVLTKDNAIPVEASLKTVRLNLHGWNINTRKRKGLELKPVESNKGIRKWEVVKKSPGAVQEQTKSIATFQFNGHQLQYSPKPASDSTAQRLALCLLEIEVGRKRQLVRLSSVATISHFDITNSKRVVNLDSVLDGISSRDLHVEVYMAKKRWKDTVISTPVSDKQRPRNPPKNHLNSVILEDGNAATLKTGQRTSIFFIRKVPGATTELTNHRALGHINVRFTQQGKRDNSYKLTFSRHCYVKRLVRKTDGTLNGYELNLQVLSWKPDSISGRIISAARNNQSIFRREIKRLEAEAKNNNDGKNEELKLFRQQFGRIARAKPKDDHDTLLNLFVRKGDTNFIGYRVFVMVPVSHGHGEKSHRLILLKTTPPVSKPRNKK